MSLSLLREHAREAAERAKMVEDFHQRRKEAAANKLRGQAQWLAPSATPPAPQSQGILAAVTVCVCWEGGNVGEREGGCDCQFVCVE